MSTIATAGAAHADPVNDGSGTPSSFDVTKIPNPGAALHLVSGTGTFVLYGATDETTGLLVFTTPGIELNNAAWLVTCKVISPLNGHTYRASGQVTPASG